MAQGISPNPLNDISKAYLDLVAKINKNEEEKVIEKWDDSSVNKVDPDLVLKVESKRTPATVVNTESYSDWRNDLREIVAEPEEKAEKEVKEKKGIKNKVVINPKLGEAVAEIGGQLLEVKELNRQVVDPQERKEDPKQDPKQDSQIKSKENRQKMLKKQVLLRKLQAVRQGAGADITASYEPDGEMVEDVKSEWKKGMKRHKKAVEAKKVKERKAVPYAALAAEYDPLEDAIEYFYEEGINEEGFDQLIEEIGLEEFVNFIEGGVVELNEERAARRASVRAKSYEKVKAEVDKSDAAKRKAKKGEYAPSYAKKETDVTVHDDKPAAKKKAPAKKTVVKKAAPKPVAKKPVTKKVEKAVAKVKKTQPVKKPSKQGLGDKIRSAYKAGVKRHRKATQVPRVFAKGAVAGAKKAVKFAKDVKKVVSEEELLNTEGHQRDPEQSKKDRTHSKQPDPSKDGFTGIGNMSIKDIMKMNAKIKAKSKKEEVDYELDERLGGKGYSRKAGASGIHKTSGDWPDSDRGAGNKAKKRAGGKVEKKSPTYLAHVHNKESYETKKKEEVLTALKKRDLKKSAKEKIAADIVKRKGDTSKSDDRYAYEEVVVEKDLNAAERRALPDKEFALPGKGKGPEGKQAGSYPIPDKTHARMALAMVAKHGTPEKKKKVRAAVEKKFPGIKVTEDKAFNSVVAALRKKHGKDAVLTKDSPKPKPPSAAEKAKASAERKKRQDADNKAYTARARKAGYKNTQDYTNVVARYGSEDNYRKGKGLGT